LIAPIADLSALGGCDDVRIKKLICIIGASPQVAGRFEAAGLRLRSIEQNKQAFHTNIYNVQEWKGDDQMGKLEGAVAVVTGASRGIGRAIAEELAHDGARVVVNYLKRKEAALDLVAKLQQDGCEAVAFQADVSDAAQAANLIQEAVNRFGRIDVLVNNAGRNIDRTMKNLSIEDWDQVIQSDLSSYFYTVKAALPYFLQQKSGTIINISSMNAQVGSFGQTNYSAAKAGVIGFTKAAARELARSNVTVNAICPGYVATDMYEAMPEKVREAAIAQVPLGRPATPREIARTVRFIVSDGDYYTGATFSINGGLYMA
jgi:acetoacetyl-CoA reductase